MPVYPISFSIPTSKISTTIPQKTQKIATIVPGDTSTYIYSDEKAYYNGYATSVFGKTCKKGGWDCLRHYEILANGCIPWFEGLEACPENTMTHFPKKLVLEAMASSEPEFFLDKLLEHTRQHLSSKSMAQYILDTCNASNPNKILFLSGNPNPDYLRCLTLIGFKELLGKRCIESVVVPHIYDDYGSASKLYGRGFSYTGVIPSSMKPEMVHIDDIRNHVFDLVVYGSVHRDTPYWDLVNSYYKPSEIILLCGEDIDFNSDTHTCFATGLAEKGYHLFVRELSTCSVDFRPKQI